MQEREEDVSVRLFDIPCHSLTPVDSHSWTRGSLINCLPLIVAVFWSNETSKTTDSWNNLTCLDSSVWKKSLLGPAIFNSTLPQESNTLSVFWGVGQPEKTQYYLCTSSTPRPCCVHIFLFLVSVFPCCSLWFELICAPFTGLTVELAASRVWLRFECVCLRCLQMSSMRKVNITWAVKLLKANNQPHPWGPRRKSSTNDKYFVLPLTPVTLVSCHTRRTHCDAAFLVAGL